jgi:hypothetical protein
LHTPGEQLGRQIEVADERNPHLLLPHSVPQPANVNSGLRVFGQAAFVNRNKLKFVSFILNDLKNPGNGRSLEVKARGERQKIQLHSE